MLEGNGVADQPSPGLGSDVAMFTPVKSSQCTNFGLVACTIAVSSFVACPPSSPKNCRVISLARSHQLMSNVLTLYCNEISFANCCRTGTCGPCPLRITMFRTVLSLLL